MLSGHPDKKGYETNRVDLDAATVINAYRQLLRIEKAFRMSKSDLKADPSTTGPKTQSTRT